MSESTFKTTLTWIPRGYYKPKKFTHDDDDAMTQQHEPKEKTAAEKASDVIKSLADVDPIDKELNMEAYDDEDMDTLPGGAFFTVKAKDVELGLKGDPYLKDDVEESEDESDLDVADEEFVLCVGHVEKLDTFGFETYVYNEKESDLYIHHDNILGAFPLCCERISRWGAETGENRSLVAWGTFEPEIEIWDTSIVDSYEPVGTLAGGHEQPVTGLSASSDATTLGSCSFDQSICLWDLSAQKMSQKLTNFHSSKINTFRFHPQETTLFASGADDKTLAIADVRATNNKLSVCMKHEIEGVSWYRHGSTVLCALRDGSVCAVDPRNASKPVWSLQLSHAPILDVTDSQLNGLVICCGEAGEGYILDVRGDVGKMVTKKDFQKGPVYTCAATMDTATPSLVAFGASDVIVWDLTESKEIVAAWSQ